MKTRREKEINFEEIVFDNEKKMSYDYLELPTARKTFFAVAFASFILISFVAVYISFLNFSKKEFYKARAAANVTREINVPTYRAVLVDKYGEQLVKNKSSFSIFINLSLVVNSPSALNSLTENLADILEVDQAELINLINNADLEKSNWIALARNISQKQAIDIKGLNYESLRVVDDYEREYADPYIFSHVLGYTGIAKQNTITGVSGLEFQYNDLIRGKDGKYVFFEDAFGEVLDTKVINAPEPSSEIKLTLDAEFQRYFYKRLKSGIEALGRNSGVGIAMDPRNGEILALISLPSFDANAFVERTRSDERNYFLTNSSKPLFNRAITGIYSPGSTIKPLVSLAALARKIVTPDTQIYSKGFLEIPNIYNPDLPSRFVDWKPHGWVDAASALARSSNIYFYLLGGGLPNTVPSWELVQDYFNRDGLGIDNLNYFWRKFGFGEKTGIDLPFESSGFLPTAEEKEARAGDIWRLGDTYNVSIGQGDLLTTPLQLLNFISSIGNGGKLYKPFLIKNSKPQILEDYSDLKDEIETVQKGMRDAVVKSYGTAYKLADLPLDVAGKTGTPQTFGNKRLNAFFAGYAPADNPELAILILVENALEGSLNTLPIAYDVFNWYYWNRVLESKEAADFEER